MNRPRVWHMTGTLFGTLLLTTCVILIIQACTSIERSFREHVIKGTIVSVEGADIYVRAGLKNGVSEGQEFDVYRIVQPGWIASADTRATENPLPETQPAQREYTGRIRIVRVEDDHFSRAQTVSGTISVGETAELTVY